MAGASSHTTLTPPPSWCRPGAMDVCYLLDASSWMHRCYHGFPARRGSAEGMLIHGLDGALSRLVRLVEERGPAMLVVVGDMCGKSWRLERFPAYKATRPPHPQDLDGQMVAFLLVCEALGIFTRYDSRLEADDIIAMIARHLLDLEQKVCVVTGDKDLWQMVRDGKVSALDWDWKIVTSADVRRKFSVEPWQLLDYLAIVGDTSDNVAGVEGLGAKGAAQILANGASLDSVRVAAIDAREYGLKGPLAKLGAAFGDAELARDVLRLAPGRWVVDPLRLRLRDARPHWGRVEEILAPIGLSRSVAQLRAAFGAR